ncbi:MAG: hypothetical protein PHT76_12140 [Anaerostipes sp.]|nr:hypothetical protein [Anaerostipes sp.]
MNTDILKSLQTYAKVYASIGTVPKNRTEIRMSLKEFKDKPSDSTIRNHLNDTFDGKLPLITIKDEKAVLDVAELRSFIEGLCKTLGIDAAILFTGPVPAPKGRRDSDAQIPSIDGVQASPAMVNMKKSLAEAVKKEKELNDKLEQKEQEITDLKRRIQEDVKKAIITEADKKIVIMSSVSSEPDEIFRRDFFLDKPSQVIDIPKTTGKFGGERESFYKILASTQLALTTEMYCKRIAERLCRSKFFENRSRDVEKLRRKDATEEEIHDNRKKSIQMIMKDNDMSNQMKLALYAGWHEYHGTEMEDLLNFAGDYVLDANYVISLLEHPKEYNNYENVRGFLRQAIKASEARMKRETARELIAGDWCVIAEYNGKPCKFQMVPVNELVKFRYALEKSAYGIAAVQLEKMLAVVRTATFEDSNPDKKMIVKDSKVRQPDDEYFKEATAMIHEAEKELEQDIHAPIDDESALEDFAESEVKENGK